MAQTATISEKSTMAEVLSAYPAARRALFQRYHIGGCSSCGFQPSDTLEEVLANHNVMDLEGTVEYIRESQKVDDRMRVTPAELKDQVGALEAAGGRKIRVVDVREQWEYDLAHIEGARLLTRTLVQEIMEEWPKDTPIVFVCHHGQRSLDAASYFMGHGFADVKSLDGGIDAWAATVEPSVARY